MWIFLREDLLNEIVPIIEKFPDQQEKEKAEEIVKEIDNVLGKSESGYALANWYATNSSLRERIDYFIESKEFYLFAFGTKVHWLLTRGACFYSDD